MRTYMSLPAESVGCVCASEGYFPNSGEHRKHSGTVLKRNLWFNRSVVGPESPFLNLLGVQVLLVPSLHCEQQGIREQAIINHTIMSALPTIIHAGRIHVLSPKYTG